MGNSLQKPTETQMGNSLQKPTETLHKNSNAEEEEDEVQVDDNGGSRTLTCEICIEPITPPNQIFKNGTNCIHPFCLDCIIKYIQVRIEENSSCQVPCPALNCPNFLNSLDCRPLIPRQLFDKWCDLLCESAVLGFERCYCPNPDCSWLILNECSGRAVKLTACPKCKRALCFKCKMTWHAGYKCRESGGLRDANDIAFGVLVETNKWKRCPSCHRVVERISGCSSVKCRCGIYFCYTCGKNKFGCRCRARMCSCICWSVFIFPALIYFSWLLYITSYQPK